MSQASGLRRAVAGALLCCVCAATLVGCAHHRGANMACRQPQFSGAAQNLPPLRAPPGLNAPNSSGGVHVPTLNAPTPALARNAPCLDWPPTYVSEPPIPPTRRNPAPGSTPSPAPSASTGFSPTAGAGTGAGPSP